MRTSLVENTMQVRLIDFNVTDQNIPDIAKHWLGKELSTKEALDDRKNFYLYEKAAFTFRFHIPIYIMFEVLEKVEFGIFSLQKTEKLYEPIS